MNQDYEIGQRVMVELSWDLVVSARIGGMTPGPSFPLLYHVVLDAPLTKGQREAFEGWFAFSVPGSMLLPFTA